MNKKVKASYTHNPKNFSHRMKVDIKRFRRDSELSEGYNFAGGRAFFQEANGELVDLGNTIGMTLCIEVSHAAVIKSEEIKSHQDLEPCYPGFNP